jgi:hypothetical protein
MAEYGEFYISPDGQSVAYYETDYEDNKDTTYIYTDGKNISLGEGTQPIGISENAKLVYFIKDGFVLCVQHGDDIKTRISLTNRESGYFNYVFNKDLTEMFYEANGGAYIVKDGKEVYKISDKPSTAPYSVFSSDYSLLAAGTGVSSYGCNLVGIDSFADSYYISRYSHIIHLNSEYKPKPVLLNVQNGGARGNYSPHLASNGFVLTYERYGEIRRCDLRDPANTDRFVLKDDISLIMMTEQPVPFYYINADKSLMFMDENYEIHTVVEDLVKKYSLDSEYINTFVYYGQVIEGDKLLFEINNEYWISDDGKEPYRIEEN